MNKERELLRRVKVLLECSNMEPLQDQADIIIKEIQQLIAEPKREPLSEDEIAELWWNTYVVGKADSVRNFAREIEKAHGIGGGNEHR
jgi:hypothetical protein